MHYIITLNVGGVYSHAYTINLWHAVRKRAKSHYRFICYTDNPSGLPNYIEARPVPRDYHNGWWSKLMLFDDPGIGDDDTATFLDLDVIPGPGFESLLDPGEKGFRILNDFAQFGEAYRFGSAVYSWRYGDLRFISDQFLAEEDAATQLAGDQNYLEKVFRGLNREYSYFDKCYSWKWHVHVEDRKPLPEDWALIAFHGIPKPIDVIAGRGHRAHVAHVSAHWEPSITLDTYRNAYAGRRAELLLTGPSLADYRQDPSMVSMGVNSIIHQPGWKLDHYLIQDRGNPKDPRGYDGGKGEHRGFRPNVAKWYGAFGFATDEATRDVAGWVPTRSGPIAERPDGYRIETELYPMREAPPFSTGHTVAITAIQMLVYMGVNEINVVGADLTGGRIGQPETAGHLDGAREEILEAWETARKFCNLRGVRLVIVNPVGLKGRGFIEHWTKPQRIEVVQESPPVPRAGSGMRFHIMGPAYSATSEEFLLCAYTQKVLKWARMMESYGYEVHHYGHPAHELPDYVHHHDVIFDDDWQKCFGDRDWKKLFFDAQNKEIQNIFNERTREILRQIVRPKDFILHFWAGNREAALGCEDVQIVEPGIGYSSTFATFKVFESYAILNNCHGLREGAEKRDLDPWMMDTVIPNYFDPKDFEFSESHADYYLYLGRIIHRKGMEIIVRLAQDNPGKQFIVAGQGELSAAISAGMRIPGNVHCAGYADQPTRKELMRNAKAVIVPSLYNEPFGGVAVEAMLSGAPVITSDNGAFPETVNQGVSGLRCRNYAQYLKAIDGVDRLERRAVRKHAEKYLMHNIAPMYDDYFTWLHHLAHDEKRRWWTPKGAR